MSNNIPFKYQTNAKPYTPVGIPKVKIPKLPSNRIKGTPKMPKLPKSGNLYK